MTGPLQKLFVGLNALALLAFTSMAHGDEVLKILPGYARVVKVPGATSKGNFTAIIGDPKVADFTYGPKNTFMFIGKTAGTTNIVVISNDSGTEIYNATILVGTGKEVNVRVYAGTPGSSGYLCTHSICAPSNVTTSNVSVDSKGGNVSGESKSR